MKNRLYKLHRHVTTETYRYGLLRHDESTVSHTLENGRLQTALPANIYEVIPRKFLSPLTETYRRKYNWFSWHLELQNTGDIKHAYIHIGNFETDTDACILVANTNDLTPPDKRGYIGESTDNFKKLYLQIMQYVENGDRVFLLIKDL